jgi:hypothetical protein
LFRVWGESGFSASVILLCSQNLSSLLILRWKVRDERRAGMNNGMTIKWVVFFRLTWQWDH